MTDKEKPQKAPEDKPKSENAEFDTSEHAIRDSMSRTFPEYDIVDSFRWGAFDPTGDESTERRLRFYQHEIGDTSPQIVFMEKKDQSMVLNFHNNPRSRDAHRLTQSGGSIYSQMYRGDGENWQPQQQSDLTEAAHIWLNGIELTLDVVDQPAFIMHDGKVETVRSLVDLSDSVKRSNSLAKRGEKLSYSQLDEYMHKKCQGENIYSLYKEKPDAVLQLVRDRFTYLRDHKKPLVLKGQEYDPDELLQELQKNSVIGRMAVEQEIMRIGIYQELLWQSGIVRPGASPHLEIPPKQPLS